MRSKSRIVKNVFLMLSVAAVTGLIVFLWRTMPDHFKELYDYIIYFVKDRPTDLKQQIGYGCVALGLVVAIIWIIRNLRAGRRLYALVGPILFNALIFFGLVFYRDRTFFRDLLDPVDDEILKTAIVFTIFASAIVIFLIATIIALIIEEHGEFKASFKIEKKTSVNDVIEEAACCCEEEKVTECDGDCNCDCEQINKEIVEIKKIVLEIRDLVNEKGLQGRKVLVKKLVTEEVVADEIEREKIISPIPAKEEPVAVLIKETDEIKPVDVEEPIEIDTKNTTRFVAKGDSHSMKVIRKPFDEKMAATDGVNKLNYNILKNELISYGVKSRVSHSGDTFRLKRDTYAKLSLVGKNLKIYLALNPAEYSDTTIPAKDVSAKKCFEETPTMLHIRSRLSLKRAKLLIAELMKSRELTQKEVKEFDFASEFVAPKQKKAKKA